jgi:hypothetical protein
MVGLDRVGTPVKGCGGTLPWRHLSLNGAPNAQAGGFCGHLKRAGRPAPAQALGGKGELGWSTRRLRGCHLRRHQGHGSYLAAETVIHDGERRAAAGR